MDPAVPAQRPAHFSSTRGLKQRHRAGFAGDCGQFWDQVGLGDTAGPGVSPGDLS